MEVVPTTTVHEVGASGFCGVFLAGALRRLYHLVICYIAMENPLSMEVLMGKSSINGPFSMAMSNNQRVVYRSG